MTDFPAQGGIIPPPPPAKATDGGSVADAPHPDVSSTVPNFGTKNASMTLIPNNQSEKN